MVPEPKGEWTKRVHPCLLPEIPDDIWHGSEWTCKCGKVWVVVAPVDPYRPDQKVLKPVPMNYISGTSITYGGITYGGGFTPKFPYDNR